MDTDQIVVKIEIDDELTFTEEVEFDLKQEIDANDLSDGKPNQKLPNLKRPTKIHLSSTPNLRKCAMICCYCSEKFWNELLYKLHVVSHLQSVTCPWCKVKFATQLAFKKHEETCKEPDSGTTNQKCELKEPEETTATPKTSSLQKFKLKQSERTYSATPKPNFIEKYEFQQPQQTSATLYVQKYELKQPKTTSATPETSFVQKFTLRCCYCPAKFSDEVSYKLHMMNHLQNSEQTAVKILPQVQYTWQDQVCPYCNKVFASPGEQRRHVRSHTNEKPFACSVCDKTFTQHINMKIHESTHFPDDQPHSCSICEKKFLYKSSMKAHESTHVAQHLCSVCGMKFTTKSSLERHEMLHTGEKAFYCEHCKKGFMKRRDLKAHGKICGQK